MTAAAAEGNRRLALGRGAGRTQGGVSDCSLFNSRYDGEMIAQFTERIVLTWGKESWRLTCEFIPFEV